MRNRLDHLFVRSTLRFLALALALAAPLVPAASAPAAADPIFASATTAYTTSSDPVHGQRFKIVGQVFLLLGESPAPLPNQQVTLEQQPTSGAAWTAVATATTTETTMANGEKHIVYTFDRVASRTSSFRVRYAGSADSQAIGSSVSDDGAAVPVLVRVHRQMPIRLTQPRPSRIFMSGEARPLYARQRVDVLRKTCPTCAWKVYARPLTDGYGRYRVRLYAPRSGSYYFVARTPASQGFALSTSQQARIRAS
ncbi:hypothetical protein ASG49_00525 [Marmoricola sp. Leaf446]|uniref:hypothetical protein n=1 Tax=Marmoricola sp. Leaf446 TaxID=1736379 RepID=UPI0006FDDFAC|nr:hypothetical protein [Marmoricola sp. Leaf446]KQT93535.1 hypothetical protein ASG49_00525 [Marmoricola sp. Leaf446]